MGSPSSTMGMGTKLLLGLALLGLVVASPLPEPLPLPLPQPLLEPLGLIGRLLGLQGSGTQHTLKKPKPFKPEEECICERTFHKKPDKKKKKPKNPCDCYGAPESGYGAPSQPVSVIYSYEPLTNEPTTYSVPASPTPEPVYIEHKPIDSYGIPEAKPVGNYHPTAPVYEPTAPAYEPIAPLHEVPAPSYNPPPPAYNPPAPVYDSPAPVYESPAPVYEPKPSVYEAPAPPVYQPKAPVYEAPVPVSYDPPAPVGYSPPAPVSYTPPAPAYASPHKKPFTAFRPIYRSFEEAPPQPLRPKFTYKLL